MHKLAICNASQLVLVATHGERVKTKEQMNQIPIIENGYLVIDQSGKIVFIGNKEQFDKEFPNSANNKYFETIIDATGKSVLPGLIDSHTHPVWTGDRVHEFALKLKGATYMDIHKMGGGIGFTVSHTRQASEEQLKQLLEQRIRKMLRFGTTVVECKSGYGLNWETEYKMLQVIDQTNTKCKNEIELVGTYLGAHSIPKPKTLQEYTKEILSEHLPNLIQCKQQGQLQSIENVDVFHEQGVFETEETRQILALGKKNGLTINFHGDELHAVQSAELAHELSATAVSHLEMISENGIELMAEKQIVAILLPTTAYILRIHYPPARKLIDKGVPVALASDFNPNAHCFSLPFVMNLSCVQMKMTLEEALVACTLNAAAALNRSQSYGSLEVGKYGDVIILNCNKWEHLIYEMIDSPIEMVIKKGTIVIQQ